MIATFLVVFAVLMLVVIGMAVGVLCGREPIRGSCGGLANVGVERACGCTDVCANEQQGQEKSASDKPPAVERYRP